MNHKATKARSGDSYLSIKDSESLDNCIQSTLSALYPPFDTTAATVLWQLFSVVEKVYRGDGLRCLIDFLVPAKKLLQYVQQETCARYTGFIFYHEGWPLCIHEKVVVQLTSLHRVRLKPGDFYIQILPLGKQSTKLVLKFLSRCGYGIEEIAVPENMYGNIFTEEFLAGVNLERQGPLLHNCLLTTGSVVYRTPWKNIVNPIFVPVTETILNNYSSHPFNHHLGLSSRTDDTNMTQTMESNHSQESTSSDDTVSTVISTAAAAGDNQGNCEGEKLVPTTQSSDNRVRQVPAETIDRQEGHCDVTEPQRIPEKLEGVLLKPSDALLEKPKGTLASTPSPKTKTKCSTKTLSLTANMGSPFMRKKQTRESAYFETRRLFRKSYMEALQNPMHLGSSSEESIAEEAAVDSKNDSPKVFCNLSNKASEKLEQRQDSFPHALKLKGERDKMTIDTMSQSSTELMSLQRSSPVMCSRTNPRRSKSLDRLHKNSQNKSLRGRTSASDTLNRNTKKHLNGHIIKSGRLDSETHLLSSQRSREHSKEDADLFQNGTAGEDSGPNHPGDQLCKTPTISATFSQKEAEMQSLWTSSVCQLSCESAGINQELLQSGAICLPGSRDRAGRAVIQICARHAIWTCEPFTSTELLHLLTYYCSIPRREVQDLGVMVLVDARKQQLTSTLFKAFNTMQSMVPNPIHCMLILVDKETAFRPEKDGTVQFEVLTSLKSLHKHIDCGQLTSEFEGTFRYNHNEWLRFHKKLDPFTVSCKEAIIFLQNSINSLNLERMPDSAQEVHDLISRHQNMMKLVLEDARLVRLRLEGGTILARLRKEEFCDKEDYRDALETVTGLYNQVDEEVHRLVLLSNKYLQQLEKALEEMKFHEGTKEMQQWFDHKSSIHFGSVDHLSLSLELVKQKQQDFNEFYDAAMLRWRQGLELLKGTRSIDEKAQKFKQFLTNVIGQTERKKSEIDLMVTLYEFYDTANVWMSHCNDYLKQLNADSGRPVFSPTVLLCLKGYHEEATKVSAENFYKVNALVSSLGSDKEMKKWNILWLKCQQTRHHLEETLSEAIKASKNIPASDKSPEKNNQRTNTEPDILTSESLGSSLYLDVSRKNHSTVSSHPVSMSSESELNSSLHSEDVCQNEDVFTLFSPSLLQASPPTRGRLQRSASVFEDTDSICTLGSASCHSEPICSSETVTLSSASCHSEPSCSPATARHRKHPLKKIMKKTQSFELSHREGMHSEGHRQGYTGVHIKGLEVASNVSAEKNRVQRVDVKSPVLVRTRSLSTPCQTHRSKSEEKWHGSGKLLRIMDEMITTEREYVRSLGYVIDSYFPEMERMDLPQDLRGKRNIIFGNMEKLYDFHCQYFLKDLEHCMDCPLRVSRCFLRHEEQFGMYALYSKNKPQSDALLACHGNTFFKNKQQVLADKMDLASYLLKPIQRMSKYALLLKDMIKECSKSQEQELQDLQAAEEMVKFQLRHGNDLLAMDAIRGCDVNLKEQGQLRCQDEFIVWCGRRKNLRHVFLFEDLILFSKTKKIDGGYDIYVYKQSFKTAEIGMTENVGDSGLRFEIWFRRRKSQDTYVLQASSTEIKAAWTSMIGKILWRQALRNRELRMQEMVSMGIGNKPFMDIKPSDAAISDRAVDYIMKGSESRTRVSIAVSSFDHSTPFKRPHSTISNSSTSSSSSQSSSSVLGSLNLHVCSSPPFNQWSYDIGTCYEEDELEQETGSQPSMITESSESSQGESVSGFSSPAHSCRSQLPSETLSDDGNSNTDSKPSSQCTSPALSHKASEPTQESNLYVTAL
ncbi:pleckstrin homology domain-containing family G member 4B isoform X2 [Protopterus annectens]|uniref:pleckstrin homology domain-containing family G member 4B isoform X2 n=1 Tax=Protopterus annectens TaxID=7888 RepID=UPI001CFA86A0|nr:pleckstrin homology domain-containing family G member 4B isoform X2 [Protopterus annectens]